ncbi:MAG: rod shape-determining protein MreD [Myxococcales bacterium]|nr:rod shape-determining protein MreD [Myxococcales bacterium]
MSVALPLLLGFAMLCAEVFLREALAADAWAPDLLTVTLVWLGAHRPAASGAWIAALLGVMADGFAGSPLGVHALHAVLLYGAAAILARQVRLHGLIGNLLLGLGGGFVGLFLLALICRVALGDTTLAARIGALLVPRVMVVALAAPLLLPLFSRLDALLVRRPDADRL